MPVGTGPGTGLTRVGDRNLFMACSHVAHDCRVGNECVFANSAMIGGHVEGGDRALISGNSAVHQFCRVGRLGLLGGASAASKDIPPVWVLQEVNGVCGGDTIGMRRAGRAPGGGPGGGGGGPWGFGVDQQGRAADPRGCVADGGGPRPLPRGARGDRVHPLLQAGHLRGPPVPLLCRRRGRRRVNAFARLHPAWRVAVLLWAVALLGVCGRVAVVSLRSGSVIPVYLDAAAAWCARADLYDIPGQSDQFRNPPGYAAAFTPFTHLHPRAAALLWRLVSVAVFLSGLAVWTRHGLLLRTSQRGTVFALSVLLVLPSLNNGQADLLLAGLLLHGTTAAVRGGGVVAGVGLAAAAAIKVYPAAVGLLAAVVLPRRVLPWFVLAAAAFAALPFLAAPPEYVAEEYRRFVENCRAD